MPRVNYITPEKMTACELKDKYYTPRELSDILGISMNTLAEYRRRGTGPKYIAFGYHTYRYARAEVLAFIEERTRASTSATRNHDLQSH